MVKKERVRAELVKAAREAFAAKGYAKATMDDVALASGKAKSTLYYYFESKEDAFRSVVDFEGEALRNILLKIVQDPRRDARQKIHDYILTRWRELEKLGNLYQTMRREFIENKDFVHKYRQQFDEIEIQLISAILKQGIESKEFSITNKEVEMVALTLFLSMKALEIPFFAKNNYRAIRPKLNSLIDILFHGIVNSHLH